MRKHTYPKDVTFSIEAEQDDSFDVRGNAMASGDDAFDREVEDEILDRLNRGDIWAWASVTVTAEYDGFRGTDHLGGCSYKDEKDFIKNSGYYEDMKQEAYNDLLGQLERAGKALIGIRKKGAKKKGLAKEVAALEKLLRK